MIGCRATAFPATPPPWRNWQRNVLVMRRLWVRVPQAAPLTPAHRYVGGPEYFSRHEALPGVPRAADQAQSETVLHNEMSAGRATRGENPVLAWRPARPMWAATRGTTYATISRRHRMVAAPSAGSVAFGRASRWYSSSTTSTAIRPPTGGKIYASSARTVIRSCRPSRAAIAAGAGICAASVTRAASPIDRVAPVARAPVRSE